MNKPDRKKLIARAWESYLRTVIPKDAGAVQIKESRQAFFAGSAVLFQTIMMVLEPGAEPTNHDMRVMDDLQHEINAFGQELDAAVLTTVLREARKH